MGRRQPDPCAMPQNSQVGVVTASVLQELNVGDVTGTAMMRSRGEDGQEEEGRNGERKDAEAIPPTKGEPGWHTILYVNIIFPFVKTFSPLPVKAHDGALSRTPGTSGGQ